MYACKFNTFTMIKFNESLKTIFKEVKTHVSAVSFALRCIDKSIPEIIIITEIIVGFALIYALFIYWLTHLLFVFVMNASLFIS